MEYHICFPKGGFIIFFLQTIEPHIFFPQVLWDRQVGFFLQTTEYHMFNANFCETQRGIFIDFFTDHRTSHSFPISVRPPRQFFIKKKIHAIEPHIFPQFLWATHEEFAKDFFLQKMEHHICFTYFCGILNKEIYWPSDLTYFFPISVRPPRGIFSNIFFTDH